MTGWFIDIVYFLVNYFDLAFTKKNILGCISFLDNFINSPSFRKVYRKKRKSIQIQSTILIYSSALYILFSPSNSNALTDLHYKCIKSLNGYESVIQLSSVHVLLCTLRNHYFFLMIYPGTCKPTLPVLMIYM